MNAPQLTPLALDDTFGFDCHPHVVCFNHCCRDLNQALTPYDVLRLKTHLETTSREFFQRYAIMYTGQASGLPVVSFRFSPDALKNCPFVTPDGCRVYAARPASCRIYPLARALHRSRKDGRLNAYYALIEEPHCKGFNPSRQQTVRQWIASQELERYHFHNDRLLQLIALKNMLRPGPLSAEHRQWTQMAFYDLDALQEKARAKELPGMDASLLARLPAKHDDKAWLTWSMNWIGQLLFGRRFDFR